MILAAGGEAEDGRTDEAQRVDKPVVASQYEVENAENDDESGEELDVLSVRFPAVGRVHIPFVSA